MKPIIVLNGGPAYDRQFLKPSLVLNKTYSTAVVAGGAVPVLATEYDLIDEYADFADGLILTGSIRYSPKVEFLKEISEKLDSEREEFDRKLLHTFLKKNKPILGICLGFQIINEQLGGTLIDDFRLKDGVEHMMTKHTVEVTEDSLLFELFGKEFYINSRHNTKLGALADSLKLTAVSKDNVMEAFEHKELDIYGVEWHPERMRGDIIEPPEGPDMTCLFEKFIKICNRGK